MVLLACTERAGVVDQNWDRGAERAGKEGLPKVKGPLDAVAANSGMVTVMLPSGCSHKQ